MKPQDIIFFIVLLILLYKQDAKYFAAVGIVSILISIPLFAYWIFFTAERLTWYAAAFFLCSIILRLIESKRNKA